LTQAEVAVLLSEQGVSGTPAQRTLECLEHAEQLRFSPGSVKSTAADALLDGVATSIAALDGAIA
ncbi:MAG: hypothetical protein R6W76_21640, partial [Caldilinea sp.]